MKYTKSITTDFFDFTKENSITEKIDPIFERTLNLVSSITNKSIYLLDVQHGKLCYVSPDASFLCDHPAEEALSLGYEFYSIIVHPNDLTRWKNMHKAILKYLDENKEKKDEINYFSCTFRLQRNYSFHPRPIFQMIHHQMKPVWEDDVLRYLICSVGSSTAKESGNLRIHYKKGLTIKEYNFASRKWKPFTLELLTERERAILLLAQQGKNTKEIADDLFKGHNTIRNQLKPVYSKFNVHSIFEAIDIFSNQRIYTSEMITKKNTSKVDPPCKRTRTNFTDEMRQCIKDHLNNGLSTRKAAEKVGISESAVRYWKKKGILLQ